MISIAITTYNRSDLTIESFINVLNSDVVSEIVIVDDCSELATYEKLRSLIMKLGHKKIRLIRNKSNLGLFLNKEKAVKCCTNEWVILLDSDNIIDNDYIDRVQSTSLQKDVLYCPSLLYSVDGSVVQWDYSPLCDNLIDRNNVNNFINDSNFQTSLNTCNHFFNKKSMIDALSYADDNMQEVSGGDSAYISYLWLLIGNKISIVRDLAYKHRVHDDSWYLKNADKSEMFNRRTMQRIREFNPPQGGFIVNKEFDIMIASSYDFKKDVYNKDPRWKILEEMYNRNFLNIIERVSVPLPRKIHQIWLGGDIPAKYKQMTDTWREHNPDWEYKLWTDGDVANMDLPNRALFDSMTNYGPKSDLLRYHILNEYGGVYADTDFECLKPFYAFTHLDFFTGIGYPSNLELYPGLVGAIPHHPISEKLVKEVCDIRSMPHSPHGVLETISSYFFTRVFFDVITGYTEGVAAFPPDYFYPFPNDRGYKKRDGRACIKDCSYALHHWCVSWLKQ